MDFCDAIQDLGLYQKNNVASNTAGNQLDLVLTNKPDQYSDPSNLCNIEDNIHIFPTDHAIVEFYIQSHINKQKRNRREVYNYKKANLLKLRQDLRASELTKVIGTAETTDQAWTRWLQLVQQHTQDTLERQLSALLDRWGSETQAKQETLGMENCETKSNGGKLDQIQIRKK